MSISSYSPHLIICVFSKLPSSPSQPPQRSSETHFQTTFFHLAKQRFPPPSPKTSSEPVNFPYFNNFLEANHAPYPPAHLFPPHIAEHSLLYFELSKVGAVRKTSAGRYQQAVTCIPTLKAV